MRLFMARRIELMYSGCPNGAVVPRCQLLGLTNRAGLARVERCVEGYPRLPTWPSNALESTPPTPMMFQHWRRTIAPEP